MEKFVKGDVVVIPFPFSNLSSSKKRPSLVLAQLKGNDLILCQITSKNTIDEYSISLENGEFDRGNLNQKSNIRPNKLFTADKSIISYKIGKLKSGKINLVIDRACEMLRTN